MGKIIAIANQKGGVGKTTSTLEIGSVLSQEFGKKVLVIDFDQQLSATECCMLEKTNTIMDIFDENCTISDAIQKYKFFDIIPGDEKMSTADKVYDKRDDIYLLADVCDALKDFYDYILIDNSPTRNVALNMAYVAADYVIVPVDATPDSLKGLMSINDDINYFKNTREKLSHAEFISFILIAYEKSLVNDHILEQLNELAENLGNDIVVDITHKTVKVKEAKCVNQTLYEYSRHSTPILDYKRITKKILEKIGD